MPGEAYELEARREITDGENPSARTYWQVKDATDYADARSLLDAALPSTFLFPSGVAAFLDQIQASEHIGDTFFEFVCSYNTQPLKAIDDTEFEFDVSAPTEPIYQSIQTTPYTATGVTAPDFNGAIGVEWGNNQPKGRPPHRPYSTFSITKHWALAAIDQAYQLQVEALVGAVSSTIFEGRIPGTVRFLGARGRQSGNKFPITYQFGFRPNVSAFVAGGITVGTASGWDLLDWLYRPVKHATAKQVVWRPHAAYVHRVHPYTSLTGLGL
ncbi:MAG: hypothetical protein AAF394_00030 [Planctomycetota bacterium]